MLVTPGTRNENAGSSGSSRRRYGSSQPPMHASTWQRTPAAWAAVAIWVTGSTTPCAYEGAEATTSTVSSAIAAVIADGTARPVVRIDLDEDRAYAEVVRRLVERPVRRRGQHHGRPRRSPARASRAACTASRIDSVPPEVTVPTVPGGPSSRAAASAIRSCSIRSRDGKAVGSRALVDPYAASASRPIASASASPESYT